MYAKYHTDALVLRREAQREDDALVVLYTADFGLVRARASAIRKESSRMRYALQDCARAQVSLVRGARGWRLAGARADASQLQGESLRACARIFALVERLAGEEPNDALFESLAEAHQRFAQESAWEMIELVSVARILHALGYLSEEALGHALSFDSAALARIAADRETFVRAINGALANTHL
jgi:recombinational DNA repair protein (RecF pathway)